MNAFTRFALLILILSPFEYAFAQMGGNERRTSRHEANLKIQSEILSSLIEQEAYYYSPISVEADFDIFLTADHFAEGYRAKLSKEGHQIKVKAGYAFYNSQGDVVAIVGTLAHEGRKRIYPETLSGNSITLGTELVIVRLNGYAVTGAKILPNIDALSLYSVYSHEFNQIDWSVGVEWLKSYKENSQSLVIHSNLRFSLGPSLGFNAGVTYRGQDSDHVQGGGFYLQVGLHYRLKSSRRSRKYPSQ